MSSFWKNKKVLVTGGAGFIGSHLVEKLVKQHALVTVIDNLQNGTKENLILVKNKIKFILGDCQNPQTIFKACKNQDIVFNLAARVGGIEYNKSHQATMLKDNLLLETTVIDAAAKNNVERFLVVSSACVYPKDCPVPFSEKNGFLNSPESTNGGYGWAKRIAELLGHYYSKEFKMKIGIVRPYNCYGPRDHFDTTTSHVIPALIKRIFDKENPLIVWGSGKQTRSFLYVEDAAEGMIRAIEKYPYPSALNLGTDHEISIKDLAYKIVSITKIKTSIKFDTTKPDGSPRRCSNNKQIKEKTGFVPKTTLDQGLKKTLSWYKRHFKNL